MKKLTLLEELHAKNGSFLIQLRSNLYWNHTSFLNLIKELYEEVQNREKENLLRQRNCVWHLVHFYFYKRLEYTRKFF